MSIYKQQEFDFIKRTQEILHDYKGEWNVTLLINCCVGLLIAPREQWYNNLPTEDVNLTDWGIDPRDIQHETKHSVKKVARHLRNSIAHNEFKAFKNYKSEIKTIKFEDYNRQNDRKGAINFSLEISVDHLKKFLYKFSYTMLEKMKSVGYHKQES